MSETASKQTDCLAKILDVSDKGTPLCFSLSIAALSMIHSCIDRLTSNRSFSSFSSSLCP